jgi:hypothetical protein
MPFRRDHVDRSLRLLPVVLLLALVLRLIYLMQYQGSPIWEQLTVDNWYHHHWAQSIADGNVVGDTTYFRAPLYVYCLGALYYLFGFSLWVGRLFGLVVGLVSISMTYVIGRRVLGKWEALVAATLHAVLPIVIYFETELLLDPLFTLLLQVAIWRFLVWLESEKERTRPVLGRVDVRSGVDMPPNRSNSGSAGAALDRLQAAFRATAARIRTLSRQVITFCSRSGPVCRTDPGAQPDGRGRPGSDLITRRHQSLHWKQSDV